MEEELDEFVFDKEVKLPTVSPKNRKLYRFAVDLFITWVRKLKKRNIRYTCNDVDTRAWNVFYEYYHSRQIILDENFVKAFIEYGITNYMNKTTSVNQKTNIRFAWCVGLPSINRWNKTGMAMNVYNVRKFKEECNNHDTKIHGKMAEVVTTIRQAEENHKGKYFNTKKGLQWCLMNTTLYFHKSNFCASCIYKDECVKLLKLNYPRVYKIRGYDKR